MRAAITIGVCVVAVSPDHPARRCPARDATDAAAGLPLVAPDPGASR